jgi:hypothetical protein
MGIFTASKMAATPLPNGDRSTAGARAQRQSTDLRPRLRGVPHGMKKESRYASAIFDTDLGLRKVPRQKLALRPSASMIKKARQGLLSEFFRSGQIIRASDLNSMVDPKSAMLSLTDSVEMETDHLSDEAERMPESERTLENLFYLCVEKDELPSYHFWRNKEDPDPISAQEPIYWDRVFRSKAMLETETTALAEYEQARKQGSKELSAKSTDIPGVGNEWMGDGKHYRDNSPKRISQLQSQNLGNAAKDVSWRPQGALANFPYYNRDQRNLQVSGQFGPQPGDPEWEKVESAWERRLVEHGRKKIMLDLESDHPEQYRELIHGKKSSMVKPARGDDEYDRQYNEVLNTTVPTVAFKLTQQHP